ncbi:uncharacterized protein ACBR49_005519 [Aulostomus maculatus]
MELYLKISTGLLLLVQFFHLASLQDANDSPKPTADPSWLRELVKNSAGGQNDVAEFFDNGTDVNGMESSNDYISGVASGSMSIFNEYDNTTSQEKGDEKTPDDLAVNESPTFPNATVDQEAGDSTNSSQIEINKTEEEEEGGVKNSTEIDENSTMASKNSSSFPHASNHTDFPSNLAPESNDTKEIPKTPDEDTNTESTNGTLVFTVAPEINKEPTTPESIDTLPETVAAPNTSETNQTGKASSTGNNAERGLADSDTQQRKRQTAWGAVLGTAVAVALVGLVAYIILKRNNQKNFSHRKLVEDFPPGPVLRLDHNEPMDLNFGGPAFFNPALQEDNIQMSNIPGQNKN